MTHEAAHTYGLLRNSFRPSQEIRTLRTYWRQRNDLVQAAGRHIQRMQKTLTQMNIQLANGKERNFTGEHFWARGYAVSTVGFELEQIRQYIREQEAADGTGGPF